MAESDNNKLKVFAKKAVIGGAVGAAAVMLPGIALSVAGFSSGGVIPGSMAAIWQSSIGNVVGGSLFAACQSVGAAGLCLTTMASIGTVGFISANAKSLVNGSTHGMKLLGSGISSSSKYVVDGSLFDVCKSVGAASLNLTTIASISTVGFISTNAKTVASGSAHGIKLLGSGISSSSKYVYGIAKSKL